MRRDAIFYQLFARSPTLLFELLPQPPENAAGYRFDSVAVKEPKFEIDGVFLPPEAGEPGIVYFCEVQFQKDERLYERLFGESLLYFYRSRERFSDWQAVVIYLSRSLEQSNRYPYRSLLNSDQVYRVYLNELGEVDQLSIGLGLMVLTTLNEAQAPDAARALLTRVTEESSDDQSRRGMIDLIITIMVYRFSQLSRAEVEAMLGMNLQQTRVYQEARIEEAQSLILRLLNRRVGDLPDSVRTSIDQLSLEQLENLGEALLDFATIADLIAWLESQAIDP